MALGSNLHALRMAMGWSRQQLSDRTSPPVGISTIGNLESRDSRSSPFVIELAAAFGLTADALLQGTPKALVADLRSRIADGYTLPAAGTRLRVESPRPAAYLSSASGRIPVVGHAQLGPDGYWREMDYPAGWGDGFIRWHSDDPNAYAVRVLGDSMRPRIKPGEFVVVEPNHPCTPGDEVLVRTRDGQSMVKVLNWHREGQIELGSINEDHRPITLADDQVAVIHFVALIAKRFSHIPAE